MDIEKILKENNNRVTKERIEIFNFLKTVHFFTYSDITDKFKTIARSSVFRNLNLFSEIWVIRKIDVWNWVNTYELNNHEDHHEHMSCQKCDKVIDFESDNICNEIFKKAESLWFEVKNHCIWVSWVCKDCKD
jgi:Fe2+ or Zn2+ uptake regulation protein